MKLKTLIILAGLVFGLSLLTSAQVASNVSCVPEKPVQGDDIHLTYTPTNGITQKDEVSGIIYLFQNYKWEVDDLSLKKEGDNWTSTYKLPENCGLFALKFYVDTIVDTNPKGYGYVWFVYAKDSALAAGAYAAWGLMRSPDYAYTIPDYFELPASAIADSVTYFWINQEISFHQKEAAPVLAYEYAKSLEKSGMTDGSEKIQRCLQYLMNNPTEKNLLKAEAIYRTVLNNSEKADSVNKINIGKYPLGAISRLTAYRTANLERDMDKHLKLFSEFLVNYPEREADKEFNDANFISYDNIYLSFLLWDLYNNKWESIAEYTPKLSLFGAINAYYKAIDIAHKRKDKTDEFLYPYAKIIIDRILETKDPKPDAYQFLSPKQWDNEFESLMASTTWASYANLLRNSGHYEEAMSFVLRAQKTLNYTVADLNDDMCHLLEQNGNQKDLGEVLKKSVYNNQVSPYMIDLLKQDYISQEGSEEGFSAYFESLKKQESASELSEKLQADKREGQMPDWEMTDGSGKKISSADLKGKAYVLDFWASWCVPCKASFPGMKLAVERYQNDPDVAFFFVDTEEREPGFKEAALKYVKDNDYPFQLLFDNKAEGAKINDEIFSKICKQFTISGIPQKIFVDKNGNVQFISVGYKGSASELADDISSLVEATKNAGKK